MERRIQPKRLIFLIKEIMTLDITVLEYCLKLWTIVNYSFLLRNQLVNALASIQPLTREGHIYVKASIVGGLYLRSVNNVTKHMVS